MRRCLAAVVTLLLLSLPTAAAAQGMILRYEGRVQWIAGSTMILVMDEGWSIRIDLTRVSLSDYSGLKPRDRIVVSGVASQDGNYVIGLSIEPARRGIQSP